MPTVYIIIYSMYHHIYTLAKEAQKGLEAQGVTAKIFQVPETLSNELLEKLHAPAKPEVPVITVDDLSAADGFLFGVPTRFGSMPAQIKSFLDSTGALWATGALSGKFVGTFFSTASQHGGQETTAYTLLTYFAHHGLNYVPLGFANSHLFDNSEVVGGSAWGAGTVANGDGSRQPTQKELEITVTQAENFAKLLNTFARGKEATGGETKAAETKTTEEAAAPAVESAPAAPTAVEPATKEAPIAAAKDEEKTTPKVVASKPKVDEKKEKDSKCFCM